MNSLLLLDLAHRRRLLAFQRRPLPEPKVHQAEGLEELLEYLAGVKSGSLSFNTELQWSSTISTLKTSPSRRIA